LLRDVLKKHGAAVPDGPLPAAPAVAAYGQVAMTATVSLWDALPALAPNPVRSSPVRTMEELGQGYGYILYSAPLPTYMVGSASVAGSLTMAGMRDRAQVYYNRGPLYQTCGRGSSVDAVVCHPPASNPASVEQLDILVENQGR
jgi:beta-galactosidase